LNTEYWDFCGLHSSRLQQQTSPTPSPTSSLRVREAAKRDIAAVIGWQQRRRIRRHGAPWRSNM